MVDFEQTDAKRVKADADRAAKAIKTVRVERDEASGAFIAYDGKKKVAEGESLSDAALSAADIFAPRCKSDVITVFGGRGFGGDTLDGVRGDMGDRFCGFDVGSVQTGDSSFAAMLSFE